MNYPMSKLIWIPFILGGCDFLFAPCTNFKKEVCACDDAGAMMCELAEATEEKAQEYKDNDDDDRYDSAQDACETLLDAWEEADGCEQFADGGGDSDGGDSDGGDSDGGDSDGGDSDGGDSDGGDSDGGGSDGGGSDGVTGTTCDELQNYYDDCCDLCGVNDTYCEMNAPSTEAECVEELEWWLSEGFDLYGSCYCDEEED
jgi:hypothetical protein